MQIVYIDTVFVMNAVTDYLLLLLTGRLAGLFLRRTRYWIAAVFGGLYAVMCFLPGFEFFAEPAVKIAIGFFMTWIAYGKERCLLRLTLLFFAISCAFAGAVLALGLLLGEIPVINGFFFTDVDTRILAAAFAAGYLLIQLVFRSSAGHGVRKELLRVKIWNGGCVVEAIALWDNGNTLREAGNGRSVLVASPELSRRLLPKSLQKLITKVSLEKPEELIAPIVKEAGALRPQLLPYYSVGKASGLMLTVCVEKAEIGGAPYQNLRVALSPTVLGNGYDALWGGSVGKGGNYEGAAGDI